MTANLYATLLFFSDSGNALMILYFVNDATTDDVNQISSTKVFITADTIIRTYTSDNLQTPAAVVLTSTFVNPYTVSKITKYKIIPEEEIWLLGTIEGNVVLGFLMFCVVVIALAIPIIFLRRYGTVAHK